MSTFEKKLRSSSINSIVSSTSPEEDADAILLDLRNIIVRDRQRIKTLLDENVELRSSNYKDEEMRRMRALVKRVQQDAARGFPITLEEEDAIQEWCEQHEREAHGIVTDEDRMKAAGVSGGGYVYEFVPTAIGVSGTIKCSRCGETFEFREID